jgi:hypothetical protein
MFPDYLVTVRAEIKTGDWNIYVMAEFSKVENVLRFDPNHLGATLIALLKRRPKDSSLYINRICLTEAQYIQKPRCWLGMGSPIAYERTTLTMLTRVKLTEAEN